MFLIEYKIINDPEDDFIGQDGYFKITCNGFSYGDIYDENLAHIFIPDHLCLWMERFVRVLENLKEHDYVALSDIESYNTWIEFKKNNEEIIISMVKNFKWDGSFDIEYYLPNREEGEWGNQRVSYSEFYNEVVKKANEYFAYVFENNPMNEKFDRIKRRLDCFLYSE